MTEHALGTFEVELVFQPQDAAFDHPHLGRATLAKRFHGDLEASSSGQMLSARTPVESSAGYVAIERVEGALAGRSGGFVLQHSSTMARGTPRQRIAVVPDSGSGELEGLAGEMTIVVADGVHHYRFDYTPP